MKFFCSIAAALLISTGTAIAQPAPRSSEYLKTTGGGAQVERKDGVGSVYFALHLEWNKSPPPGAYLVTEFENTSNVAAPHLVETTVALLDTKPMLRSPIYSCIINNRRYNVIVKVYSDSSKQDLIATHSQELEFRLPRNIFRQLNLKECGG